MKKIKIKSEKSQEMIDITSRVNEVIDIQKGLVSVFIKHTSAGITINENSDVDVRKDILKKLNELVPQEDYFRHAEGNSDAHVKSSIFGSSVLVPVLNKKLQLGRWQGIFFCEFDGPRKREVLISEISN